MRRRRAAAPGAVALTLVMVVLAGCGGGGSSGTASSTPTIAPPPASSATAHTQVQATAVACSSALSPWTEYIADSDDFGGWVDTVGAKNPLVSLPQEAAHTFLREEPTKGAKVASADGFRQLDAACDSFAAAHPDYPFDRLPVAPSLPSD